jgi:hypothetical protein
MVLERVHHQYIYTSERLLREVFGVPPTSQHTNLLPLIEGPAVRLAGRHAKVRREGYRTRRAH